MNSGGANVVPLGSELQMNPIKFATYVHVMYDVLGLTPIKNQADPIKAAIAT